MPELYPQGAVLMAPVAGHTDWPMRRMIRFCGCRYAFTEMIDAGSLVYQAQKTLRLMERRPDEPFLGVQIVGSGLPVLKQAVRIINGMNFDVLDFNLGCPAPKVARKCEGISFAMLKPDEALKAVETIVRTSEKPVTVKTRILSETEPEKTVAFCKRLEAAGISALTLHGRIMKMFYSGPVFFDIIRMVQQELSIPVIANGGALTGNLYRTLIQESGCSRGMVARGALGNPWIFREILEPDAHPPTIKEFIQMIRNYMSDMVECYGPVQAYVIARKTILDFLKGRGFSGALRASVSYLSDGAALEVLLEKVAEGPSERYWDFLRERPEEAERKLYRES